MNVAAWTGMALLALVGLLVGWLLGSRTATAGLERLRTERDSIAVDRTKFQTQTEDLARLTQEQKAEIQTLRDQRAALTTEAARAEEQLKAAQQSLASERELLTAAEARLTDTFKSLAGEVLRDNNKEFLGLANREFSAKEGSIEKLLSPVRETLNKVEKQTQELETERAKAYTEVLTEIRNVQKTHETLRQETTQLVQALRAPKARGNWGELQLKRCIEFAGMVERCSFEVERFMKASEDGAAQRPDVVVQLPNGRCIVIDAKTPLDAFLSAMNCTDDGQKDAYLQAHAMQVRSHLSQLGGKQYWQRFQNSPDFVVCFLPSEVLFSAALEQDPSLIEVGSQLNVILATPTTLIALLKAVAYGWQQMEITRNAIEICKAGEDLYKKLAGMQKHFANLGNALDRSVDHFHSLVGAVAGKDSVFDKAAKLHKLGIGQDEIPEVKQIEGTARVIPSSHWDEPIALAAAEETSKQ